MTDIKTVPQGMPSPDPMYNLGATTTSSKERETVGGQKADVKQGENVKGIVGVTSTDLQQDQMSVTQKKLNLYVNTEGPPGEPEIGPVKNFNLMAVKAAENPWLQSTFMTKLTMTLAEIVMYNKDIHKSEAVVTVQQLQKIWAMAESNAALIMAKAEKEAAMHMGIAICGVACVALAVVGTIMSAAAAFKGGTLKNEGAMLEAKPVANPTASGTAGAAHVAPVKPPPNKAALLHDSPPPSSNIVRTPPPRPNAPAPATYPAPSAASAPPAPKTVTFQTPPAKTQATAPSSAAPANPSTPGPQAKSEMTPDQKLSETMRINTAKADNKGMGALGTTLSTLGVPLNTVFENFIQMIFKPQIAAIDAQIELVRAIKELASKALDSSMQSFNQAIEALKEAIDLITRAIAESIKANSITRN